MAKYCVGITMETDWGEEADSRPMWFCPEDEMKVWWACRIGPARYARLAEFAEARGLGDEARFWRRSLAALEGHRIPTPSD